MVPLCGSRINATLYSLLCVSAPLVSVEKVLTLIISAGGRGLPSRGPNDRMTIEPLVLQADRSLFRLASGHGSASLALQAPCARFVFQQAPGSPPWRGAGWVLLPRPLGERAGVRGFRTVLFVRRAGGVSAFYSHQRGCGNFGCRPALSLSKGIPVGEIPATFSSRQGLLCASSAAGGESE